MIKMRQKMNIKHLKEWRKDVFFVATYLEVAHQTEKGAVEHKARDKCEKKAKKIKMHEFEIDHQGNVKERVARKIGHKM